MRIQPDSETGLRRLVTTKPHAKNLADRLRFKSSVVELSPKLGSHVIERLASIPQNHSAMRAVAESLSSPKRYRDAAALQEDAIRTALHALIPRTPTLASRALRYIMPKQQPSARCYLVVTGLPSLLITIGALCLAI
jgi:citrate synthase